MKNTIISLLVVIVTFSSCTKEETSVLDAPFVHINFNNLSTVEVNSNRKDIVSYYIYLSTKPLEKDMLLDYSIVVGDGLKEGRDFKIITTEYPLVFPIGIYRRPIQIQWLDNPVDPTKNNTIIIKLNSNNLNIPVGFPGRDANQSKFYITKVNS